nr:immunoglobulin heavy chain junction region [Mus musculus]
CARDYGSSYGFAYW